MSVEGCYTDFHIDFGGTSVWYHILRGSKVGLRVDLEPNACMLLLTGAEREVCVFCEIRLCVSRCSG